MAIEIGLITAYEPQSQAELVRLWPRVRNGLNEISEKCDGWHFMPEDIYHGIKTGQYRIVIGNIDGFYAGFTIISVTQYPDGPGLHVVAWHSEVKGRGIFKDGFAVIDKIAEGMGAVRVSYSSSRPGVLKMCEGLGFSHKSSINYFEKEL